MRKDFYIFRHGQSSYNAVGRTQGRTNDSVLTEIGHQQALEVGQKLKNRGIEIIISSPLKRAMETAKLANEALDVPVIMDERFIEVDVGEVEGLMHEDIVAKCADLFHQWHSDDVAFENVCYKGGETKKQVRQRVFGGLEDYAHHSHYKAMAISSHGIMLSQILIAMKVGVVDVPNGAILHIAYENDSWKVIEWI